MKILITNDDGLQASQLIPLIKWAQKLGDVTTVVPKYEQSGKSHGIELRNAFEVSQVTLEPGITVTAVDSTPADCVRYAIMGMQETYDLVISGINRGLNMGRDIMYSGTVSAVLEAANLGVQAVAFSTEPKNYADATLRLDDIWNFMQEHRLLQRGSIYNINIPKDAGTIRITRQGGPYYSDDFILQENGLYAPHGKEVFVPSGNMELDTDAVLRGKYISISPLTLERTDMQLFRELQTLNL